VLDDGLEERLEVWLECVRLEPGATLLGDRIDDGRLELVGVLRQLEKQVVQLLERRFRLRFGRPC